MLAQIPEIDKATELKPETFKGGFIWAANFKLPKPAEQDGFIVQAIRQAESGTVYKTQKAADGSFDLIESKANKETVYWEAWEVKKGETTPRQQQTVSDFVSGLSGKGLAGSKYQVPVNDIFFKNYGAGSVGKYKIYGLAGFYHITLPVDFIVGNTLTGAGQLRSTTQPPSFYTFQAGLARQLEFTFNFMDNIAEMKGVISSPPPRIWDVRDIAKAFGF